MIPYDVQSIWNRFQDAVATAPYPDARTDVSFARERASRQIF